MLTKDGWALVLNGNVVSLHTTQAGSAAAAAKAGRISNQQGGLGCAIFYRKDGSVISIRLYGKEAIKPSIGEPISNEAFPLNGNGDIPMSENDNKNDQEAEVGGTVAGRAATVVSKKPEAASPGADEDKKAAEQGPSES